MLNHLWLALIAAGILAAAGRDIHDGLTNAYGNGIPWILLGSEPAGDGIGSGRHELQITLGADQIRKHFPSMASCGTDVTMRAVIIMREDGRGSAVLTPGDDSPEIFRTMARALGGGTLTGAVAATPVGEGPAWSLQMEPVRFVAMRAVTAAAFDAAALAVQIAIGLIGIMALWLGVMKIAEQAGLVARLAALVRPLTVRLFPEVPPDHPAIAAILMNVSANMLGLGNAATPFGLKAMEELNRINPSAGTASNSMCTFLAMNTSCVTLIPATAVAVRAASGSADPAIIIGTTFLASLTAAVAGVTAAKLLQRLRVFRMKEETA